MYVVKRILCCCCCCCGVVKRERHNAGSKRVVAAPGPLGLRGVRRTLNKI
jgi:hypothetical protein